MNELRWSYGKPDSAGIWANYIHSNEPDQKSTYCTRVVFPDDVEAFQQNPYLAGYWCKISDLPTILPPKKKVKQYLWVFINMDNHSCCFTWEDDGCGPLNGQCQLSPPPLEFMWHKTETFREIEK